MTDYLARAATADIGTAPALGMIDRVLTQQAYTLATNDLYWITSGIMVSIAVLVWFSRPPFGARH